MNVAENLDGTLAEREGIRVLHLICPTGYYGAERWIVALAGAQLGSGVSSELAATSERRCGPVEVLERFPNGPASRHRIEMNGRFDPAVVRALVDVIAQRRADIVHTHGYKSDLIGLLAARRAGVACVSTPHGFGHDIGLKLRAFIRIGAFALRYFDKVVPLSLELADDVRRLGVPESKLEYIANGTDLMEIEQALQTRRVGDDGRRLRLGYVGQLIARKRIGDILDMFDALWRERRDVELVITGDGPERAALEARAGKLASSGAITFTGYVEDRLKLMLTLDLFVMTSASEGIPRCMMEAMGLGIAVLAYDIPGVDQLVEDGRTGALVPLGDRGALLRSATELMSDPDGRTRLGENARHRVRSEFSADRMAKEYAALYASVLDARRRAVPARSAAASPEENRN